MKPDVLTNASVYSPRDFAEVEASARAVQSLWELSVVCAFWKDDPFPFIPPLKISPLLLAESGLVIESHQAN